MPADHWTQKTQSAITRMVRARDAMEADPLVYRRTLSLQDAFARLAAARLSGAVSKGAFRRKEKRLMRRHPAFTSAEPHGHDALPA